MSTELHTCGYPEDSYACKIRHIAMNTGAAKAALDVSPAAKSSGIETYQN